MFVLSSCTADTDGDRLNDSVEEELGTDPFNKDTDGDGVEDGLEVSLGLDPLEPDTDGDGLRDGSEFDLDLDPTNPDTDGDGLFDRAEVVFRTDPTSPDTDRDGLTDGAEINGSTDPLLPDTDGDGMLDGAERTNGTDPNNWDTDGDLLPDGDELDNQLDPLDPDTDDDGFLDGVEMAQGADPLDPYIWDYDGGSWPDRTNVARPDDLQEFRVGFTIPNSELIDGVGRPVTLHQFFGYVVRIDIVYAENEDSAYMGLDARYDWEDHRDDGYIVVQVVVPPTPELGLEYVNAWVRQARVFFPVLDGSTGDLVQGLQSTGVLTDERPTTLLLDRQLIIQQAWSGGPGEDFAITRDTLLGSP